MKYKPVIGLEIHTAVKTKTKMFCDSFNDPDEKHPNVNVCPVCMGHPGTLPFMNVEAVKKVILAGLALNCKINKETFFERKNYFYPDLPKGYQISQYQKPFCADGKLEISGKTFRITRIHLEEDAGRLYHLPGKNYSLVDYNRAGVPLMELVTEPDFETGQEVKAFAEELQLILKYLGVSDADMEKGLMRVEVNISLTNPDGSWGTKVEVKNLNSIKAASDSVDYEIKRQTEVLESGGKIKQETRGWDESQRKTVSQRSKEEAHDYRYFPEPDLPPVKLEDAQIEGIKAMMAELPEQRRQRFVSSFGLPSHDVEIFVANMSIGNYFENVASELASFDKLGHLEKPSGEHRSKLLKLGANYLITELKRMCDEINADIYDTKIKPEGFADFVVRVFHGQVSSSGAQVLLKEMFETGDTPGHIIENKDLAQVSDESMLTEAISKVITDNQKAVEDFKAGKEASLKFLIGMVMKESKGKANPQVVEKLLKEVIR